MQAVMEISLLKVLLENISLFLHLSSFDNVNSDPVQKYYQRAEEIFKLLKPILDAIIDSEIASDEALNKAFEEFRQSIDELRELFENWQPLLSKVYFVSQQIVISVMFCDFGADLSYSLSLREKF